MPDITLAHGDGGSLTHRLVAEIFLDLFDNPFLRKQGDAAVILSPAGKLAVTTDSFVVDPIFFPGGDIGKLAVCGTVNDLSVSGAEPYVLTAGFIIEEGLEMHVLKRIAASMARTAREAGVPIVAGDTKVVPHGRGDKVYINTTGIGVVMAAPELDCGRISAGDKVIISGTVGDHGMAVLAARERFGLEGQLASDCAALNRFIQPLLKRFPGIKVMRDPTRGGLATTAKELAAAAKMDFMLYEEQIPVAPSVQGAAELLGLDPLYLACEGRCLAVVEAGQSGSVVSSMRRHPLGRHAQVIGEVEQGNGNVYLKTALGGTKYLDLLSGSQFPRIC